MAVAKGGNVTPLVHDAHGTAHFPRDEQPTPGSALVRNDSCDAGDLFFLRFYSGLRRPEHDRVRAELEATLIEMATLDAEAIARANRRRELLEKAKRLRDQVWPIIPHHHGRRPPGPDERPLPPLVHDPEPLSGRRLRSVCLALLERYGELPLAELHSHLHMHGYVVAGPHGVKRLADALAYEVRRARAVRTKRGCYRRAGGERPRRGRFGRPRLNPRVGLDPTDLLNRYRNVDPFLFERPERWYPELPDLRGT